MRISIYFTYFYRLKLYIHCTLCENKKKTISLETKIKIKFKLDCMHIYTKYAVFQNLLIFFQTAFAIWDPIKNTYLTSIIGVVHIKAVPTVEKKTYTITFWKKCLNIFISIQDHVAWTFLFLANTFSHFKVKIEDLKVNES